MPSWTCVVPHAPRYPSTIAKTATSLFDAGWTPILFSEPPTPNEKDPPPEEFPCIKHRERKGAWFNTKYALEWALNHSNSELILYAQDDCVFHPEAKVFVENCLWPSPKTAFISLYTPSHYTWTSGRKTRKPGLFKIEVNFFYGACGLVFHRSVLEAISKHPLWNTWMGAKPTKDLFTIMELRKKNPWLVKHVDTALGTIINDLGLEFWSVMPSLVQHIGNVSVLGHAPATGRRVASHLATTDTPLIKQIQPPKQLFELEI